VATNNTVQYTITAKDQASAVFAQVATKAKGVGAGIAESFVLVGAAAYKMRGVVSDGFKVMTGDFTKLGNVFGALPGPIGQVAQSVGNALGSMIQETVDAVKAFDKLSQATGASVEFLSAFTEAADDMRISSETVSASLTVFSRKLGGIEDVMDGSGVSAGAFAAKLQALGITTDNTHEAALIAGEAFLVVWVDPVTRETTAAFNDPRLCHVAYDPENGRRKVYAAKLWCQDEKTHRLNLYYPDRIEYYEVGKGGKIAEIDMQPNPFGVIPVFHFRNKGCASDLESVVPLQDGVNKLLIDMMVAAEFGAFPQRYVISGSDTKGLKNEPGAVWDLAAGDGIGQGTAAGQFEPTQLKNYHEASAQLVSTIGAITCTPKHLFYQGGGDPSGDALIAMEAPLIKKAQDRIDRFVPEWRAAARFILQLLGLDVPLSDIEPVFAPCETVQPLAKAQIRKLSVEAGIPLDTAVREEGWSQSEIDQMHQDAADMAGAQQASLASVLVNAQRGFDQGPNAPGAP
jgi:hypothetical protein